MCDSLMTEIRINEKSSAPASNARTKEAEAERCGYWFACCMQVFHPALAAGLEKSYSTC